MIALTLLICLPLLITCKLSILVDNDQVFSTPTHDYFQRSTPSFNVTGIPVRVNYTLDDSESCTAVLSPLGKDKYAGESILLIDIKQAQATCNLKTFSDAFGVIKDYAKQLEEAGLPPTSTLVYLMWVKSMKKYQPGAPFTEPYSSRDKGTTESSPPSSLKVAIMDMENVAEFWTSMKESSDKSPLLLVEQQSGDWNRVFMGGAFRAFVYIFFIMDIVMVLLAIGILGKNTFIEKEDWKTLRNGIIVLAMLSTLFYAVAMLLPIRSFAPGVLNAFAGYFIHLAFFLLLFWWSKVLSQAEKHPLIRYFQIITLACVGIATMEFIMDMLFAFIPPSPGLDRVKDAVDTIYSLSRLVIAAVFLGAAGYFEWRRRGIKTVKNADTLRMLTIIGVLTFVCFLILASVQLYLQFNPERTAASYGTILMIRIVTGVMRSAVLLVLLIVKSKTGGSSRKGSMLESGNRKPSLK